MPNLILHQTKDVLSVIDAYPQHVSEKLYTLRQIILDTADEIESIKTLEETLKWGEPSYLAKKGSTLRIDWKPKKPDQYAMYFKCTSKLVNTFKEVYGDLFRYETTRALVFSFDEDIPTAEIKECIKAALIYHEVKNEVFLRMKSRV